MNRREFLQASAATTAAAALGATAQAAEGRRRPNLLYVFSDQHRALSLPGEAYSPVVAPNIEAFGRQNFSMERCVSNYPLCTPYRGILISGRWPYQTGIIHNNVPIGTDEYSLGTAFRQAGYHTGYVGKWHLQGNDRSFVPPGPERQGFEDWHAWGDTNAHYHSFTYNPNTGEKIQPPGWNCTSMTDQAIEFLGRQSGDRPWLLVVSWNPPHPPFNPPKEDADLYPTDALQPRPNVRLSLVGQDVQGAAKPLTSDEALRQAMQGYYGGITGVDKEFGRLLAALEEAGHADDTIVVYTSDHGEMLGSQGRMSKQVPFEEACRVPFFVRYPGVTPSGTKSEMLFAAVDIYPTLCGLASIEVPNHCVGRDLSEVIRGIDVTPQHFVFLMNQVPERAVAADPQQDDEEPKAERLPAGRLRNVEFVNLPTYRGVRTATHTYAVASSGRWCLYDNRADPYQLNNLVRDPSQRALLASLDAEIAKWLRQTGDPFPYADAISRFSDFPA